MDWRKWFGSRDRDVAREIQAHLDLEKEEKMASGLTEREAGLAARRAFGNETFVREDVRLIWRWMNFERAVTEWKLAFRSMRRKPAFAVTLILTLALGIGAATTVFALIDAVLLKPLPFAASDRLIVVAERRLASGVESRVSPGRLEDWNSLSRSFEGLAGCYPDSLSETSGEMAERLSVLYVSPRFFTVLKADPALGRVWGRVEEEFGGPLVAVISDGLWRRRFGGGTDAIGKSLRLGDQAYAIVGVMPSSFEVPALPADVWIPKQASAGLMRIREARFYRAFGVLRSGISPNQAQDELGTVQKSLGERYPRTDAGLGVSVKPLKETLVGSVQSVLWMVFGAVGLLLLIACANAGSLFLVQASQRAGEMSTRAALGAGSGAVVRLLLSEGFAYSCSGALVGFGFAAAGVHIVRSMVGDVPRAAQMQVDWRVASFAAGLCLLTSALFSLAPILHAIRRDVAASLRTGRAAIISQRLPNALVGVQFAMAAILLVGAGLGLRSLSNLRAQPLGFRTDDVLTLRLSASFQESSPAVAVRHVRTFEELETLPGVRSVAAAVSLPGTQFASPQEFQIAGETSPTGENRLAAVRMVTAKYFDTAGIALQSGQTCAQDPGSARPFQALVNRAFVDQYFLGREPIGRTLVAAGRTMDIAGVTGNVREEGFAHVPEPLIYACGLLRFWPDPYFLIRTAGDPAASIGAVRRKLREIEPSRAVYEVRPLKDALSETLGRARFQSYLVMAFSLLALLLASLGLYGVMSYLIVQRTREFGLRAALGARPAQILTQILRTGLAVGMAGGISGMAVAVPIALLARNSFYGVSAFDRATFSVVAVTLTMVCFLACLIPGMRATSIDPSRALRSE